MWTFPTSLEQCLYTTLWNLKCSSDTLSCYRKKLQNLFHLNCGRQIYEIWIQLITACGNIARQDVQNTHHWSKQTETATENRVGQAGSCRHCGSHLSVSGVVGSSRSVMRVLYTVSCNILHMLLSTGFKSGIHGGHGWGRINSGVSFCNNLTVALRAQWAFQISQGSVETLLRWNGKRLLLFAFFSFEKQFTKFHQNRPSFIGDITTKQIGFFSLYAV